MYDLQITESDQVLIIDVMRMCHVLFFAGYLQ